VPLKFIAILEDNAARAATMRLALARSYAQFNVIIFRDAADMIRWLDRIIGQTVLISLDHDLLSCDPPDAQGRRPWPGTGREVADHLVDSYPCVCPVIVHTSNAQAAPGMMRVLREAGWVCSAIMPHDDLAWIGDWLAEIELYRQKGLLFE
jgi:hypothetical protein